MGDDDATANARARAGVEAIFERYHVLAAQKATAGLHDAEVMRRAELLWARPGAVEYRLEVPAAFANVNDVMHGGSYGVVFDNLTMTCLGTIARPGYWEFMAGVTRTLNISYLRAVRCGDAVRVRCWVVQHGRSMALVRAEMTDEAGAVVYATAEHHKFHTPALPAHMDVRTKWDDDMEREAAEQTGQLADGSKKAAAKL